MIFRRGRRGRVVSASLQAAGIVGLAIVVALGIPGMGRAGQGRIREAQQVKLRPGMKALGRTGDGPLTVYTVETYSGDEVDADGDDDTGEPLAAPNPGLFHDGPAAGAPPTAAAAAALSPPGGTLGSRGPPDRPPVTTSTVPFSFAGFPLLISPRRRKALAGLLITASALAGCAKTTTIAAARKEPFQLEKIDGTERKRIRLEPKAVERLHIETVTVTGTAVPYGAVLYDTTGGTAVYTVPEAFVYVRHPVTVASFDGDTAVLSTGPPPGTVVVTAGSSELAGIEFGVGK
jgi:hypothetical protein